MLRKQLAAFFLVVGPAFIPSTAQTEDPAVLGRKILRDNSGAVLTVRLVIKEGMSFGSYSSHEYESKSEIVGTVLDASGLTLLSLSETNPTEMFGDLFSSDEDDGAPIEMRSEVSDVQFVLPDGTEIPARIVLRDNDLDLAFARPSEPVEQPFPSVDLEDTSTADILDQVVVIQRMGRTANRTPRITLSRIEAILEKPRRFYVLDIRGQSTSLGCPVFTLDGKMLGVILLRSIRSGSGFSLSSLFSAGLDGFGAMIAVLPCEDILEVAAQAPRIDSATTE